VFVSATGSDSGANCKRFPTLSAPPQNPSTSCATINRAYQLAQPGDNVEVGAGSYPVQTISGTKSTAGHCDGHDGADTSACVLVRPAAGAPVTVAGLSIQASYVRVSGFTVSGPTSLQGQQCAHGTNTDVLVENITSTYLGIFGGIGNVTVRTSSFGPLTDNASQIFPCGALDSAHPYPTDILLDNDTWHDYHLSSATAGIHMECLHIDAFGGARGLILRRSLFRNCAEYDVSFTNIGAFNGNVLLENNFLGAAAGAGDVTHGPGVIAELGISGLNAPSTFVARFNSIDGIWNDANYPNDHFAPGSGFIGNVVNTPFSAFSCNALQTQGSLPYDYMVSLGTGVPCGSHAIAIAAAPWVASGGSANLHLTTCSTPIHALVPASVAGGVPAVDFDGRARSGGTTDAGAALC
jgi:hypothetical protein